MSLVCYASSSSSSDEDEAQAPPPAPRRRQVKDENPPKIQQHHPSTTPPPKGSNPLHAHHNRMSSRKDPAWQYGELPDPKNTNNIKCIFCPVVAKGGITRLKQHFIGGFRNIKSCDNCPEHVREEMRAFMEKKKALKEQMNAMPHFDEVAEEQEMEQRSLDRGKSKQASGSSVHSSFQHKPSRQIVPLDIYYRQNADEVCVKRKRNSADTILCDDNKKGMREYAVQKFARWMYDNAIPFNAVNCDSFAPWVEAFGEFGLDMKPPTHHEISVVYLKKEKEHTKTLLKCHEEEQAKYGCTIMAATWSDKKSRSLINFLVNTSRGSRFIKSVDVSSVSHTGEFIFSLLNKVVQRVGEKDVVQVITNSTSSNVLAGRLLEAKYPHLYRTPCAAHCLDLMLEDIFKIPLFKKTIGRAIKVSGYICGRLQLLSMMRDFTSDKEMVRAGKTRYVTAFLTLKNFHEKKTNLKKMFTSETWTQSKYAKEEKGKTMEKVILTPSFWNNVLYATKIVGPLLKVLRLVDGEKKPPMGYIYEAMDRAKKTIKASFGGNEEKYAEVFEIIDRRWEIQLHRPLHAAGYILNPEFFYANADQKANVMKGFYECVERLAPDVETEDKIIDELLVYMKAEKLFGLPAAIRQRTIKSPTDWWFSFGSSCPNLQKFAIKVLSLTCSSSGCERNWSIFDRVHTQKRNKLLHEKMSDLVFIKYNRSLLRRYDMRNHIDPISMEETDGLNEWLVGEMEEDENDLAHSDDAGLTCGVAAEAAGVNVEASAFRSRPSKTPRETTRKASSSKASALKTTKKTSTSSSRSAHHLIDEDEDDVGYKEDDDDIIGDDDDENEENGDMLVDLDD